MNSPSPNSALAKLRAHQLVKLYVTGNFATPRHVDFICRTGLFDAIWLDLEHFDLPTQEVAVLNLVTRAFPVTTIARFKAADYQTVMRILETGVGGIMCSMVNSAAEARQIVQWAKFNNPSPAPGEVTGTRGWNGGNIDAACASRIVFRSAAGSTPLRAIIPGGGGAGSQNRGVRGARCRARGRAGRSRLRRCRQSPS